MNDEPWSTVEGRSTRFGRIALFKTLDSTQNEARRRVESGKPGVVIAKRQVQGRGRQGRVWQDVGGAALSMSLAVRSELPPAGLSIAIGLGVIDGCSKLGANGLAMKWPNDVVERTERGPGRKLAGVLIEAADSSAVVGIGVNVRSSGGQWTDELARSATSLEEVGVAVSRPRAALAVLEGVARRVDAEASEVRDSWHANSALRGHWCRFRVEGRPVEGTVLELDPQWRLVLKTAKGGRLRVDAAFAHFEEVLSKRD